MLRVRKLGVLFLIGAVLGSVFDGFHTFSETTAYSDPWIWRMAWWTPLLFGFACAAIGDFNIRMDRVFGDSETPTTSRSWFEVIIGLIVFGAMYFCSGFLPLSNGGVFGVLACGTVVFWFLFGETPKMVLTGVVVALVGCLVEIGLIHLRTFYYLDPQFFGIPFWLFFLYVSGSIAVGNLARKLSI